MIKPVAWKEGSNQKYCSSELSFLNIMTINKLHVLSFGGLSFSLFLRNGVFLLVLYSRISARRFLSITTETSFGGFPPTNSAAKPEVEVFCEMGLARLQPELTGFIHCRPTHLTLLVRSGLTVCEGKLESAEEWVWYGWPVEETNLGTPSEH